MTPFGPSQYYRARPNICPERAYKQEAPLKVRACIAIAAVTIAVAAVHAPAAAATPKCFGKKATIVSSGTILETGESLITGTKKDDVIFSRATAPTNYIVGGGGDDLICGGRNFDWILGGPGNDKMKGKGDFDFLEGGPGNDILVGDKNDGQNDAGMYSSSPNPMNVNLATGVARGHGTDKLTNIESLFGSVFDDTIVGSPRTDFLWGLEGDDHIEGGEGFDFIDPGLGDDFADGQGADFDIIYFQYHSTYNHPDTGPVDYPVTVDLATGIATGQGNDTFVGFEGIYGSNHADTLRGDEGDNAFLGGGGNDILDGRGGFDVATYWLSESAVTANLQTGSGSSATEGTDTYTSIEGLNGSIGFGDTLTGDNGNNLLDGDGGDDTLIGNGGDDLFYGNSGNDTVQGGPGTYDFWDYYGTEALNANLGTGLITTPTYTVNVTGMEAVAGGDAPDILIGNEDANVMSGWGGNDVIVGAGGNDQIDGGEGDDEADGGPGHDDCVATESPVSCEGTLAVRIHPLQAKADAIAAFRRHI